MICNYTEKGWLVVTQRAHGVLAAQLAAHWKEKDRPLRWTETVLAIAEHDDAENELDGEELLTPTGGPLDLSMKGFDLAHCQKLAALTLTKSRYIALLTSMHMQFVYGRFAKENAEARTFLEDQAHQQSLWCKELGLSKSEAERIYNLLEWCDAFSLLLCKGEMQPEGRSLEISTGPDKKAYQLIQINEDTLTVDPWPFQQSRFEVRFDTRTIARLQFSSSGQFRKEFLLAPTNETVWVLQKGKRPKPNTGKVNVG